MCRDAFLADTCLKKIISEMRKSDSYNIPEFFFLADLPAPSYDPYSSSLQGNPSERYHAKCGVRFKCEDR